MGAPPTAILSAYALVTHVVKTDLLYLQQSELRKAQRIDPGLFEIRKTEHYHQSRSLSSKYPEVLRSYRNAIGW